MTIVKIENTGKQQTLVLPDEFRVSTDKVYIKKISGSIHIYPYGDPWQTMIDSLDEFTEDYMETRNQPPDGQRESL